VKRGGSGRIADSNIYINICVKRLRGIKMMWGREGKGMEREGRWRGVEKMQEEEEKELKREREKEEEAMENVAREKDSMAWRHCERRGKDLARLGKEEEEMEEAERERWEDGTLGLERRQRWEMEEFERRERERWGRMREEIGEVRRREERELERRVGETRREEEEVRRVRGKERGVLGWRRGWRSTRIDGVEEECEKLLA
jgi:hypothetical protein